MGNTANFISRFCAISTISLFPACAELERAQRGWPDAPAATGDAGGRKDSGGGVTREAAATTPKPEDAKPQGQRHVLRGSGRFLNKAPRRAQAFQGKDGGITLNFVNAEITEVVRAVLGGILNLNFTVDSGVKGSITLQTSRPIPRAAVLAALESALDVAGAAMVPSAGIYRIVPRSKAPRQGGPTTIAGDGPGLRAGFAVRIVPLKFVSAVEMEKILKPLAFKGTIVRVDSTRNLLILAAPAPEIRALEEMITVFDVDWLAGLSLAMIPLEYVNPEVLVKEIAEVLGKDKDNPLKGVLRFVPMTRLNSVLVITTQAAYLRRAEDIIAKLDQGSSGTERQLFVYRVQNADAGEIANTLGQLFGAKGRAPSDLRGALAPQLDPARVRIKPYSQTSSTASQPAKPQGQGTAGTPTGRMASAPDKPSPKTAAAFTIDGADQIRIVADKTNNAILVWATPVDYRMVVSVLRKLDQVPLQVLIEATIAEVTLNETLRYGVQWFLRQGNSELTLSSGTTSSILPTFPGFSYFLTGPDVKAIFDALETVTDLNIISSPQLMVLDNQTAELQVGDQVPVLTQSLTTAEGSITESVEYRDSGIILRVTPRVNSGGLVTMRIEQEVSTIVKTAVPTLTPTIQQRRISSTVAVQSGETVVLGGLIQDTRDRKETGVPILRDIPILGFFFGGKEDDKKRTELLVLITPRAVRSQREVRRVTEELRKRLRAVIPLDMKIR
ncbi:MAG: type II secretion system secretin GspD [Alphaproteobacteria bacterium]|nr:type II secretion system secretin GspD [Alphaproteobacteria bacterium]